MPGACGGCRHALIPNHLADATLITWFLQEGELFSDRTPVIAWKIDGGADPYSPLPVGIGYPVSRDDVAAVIVGDQAYFLDDTVCDAEHADAVARRALKSREWFEEQSRAEAQARLAARA